MNDYTIIPSTDTECRGKEVPWSGLSANCRFCGLKYVKFIMVVWTLQKKKTDEVERSEELENQVKGNPTY